MPKDILTTVASGQMTDPNFSPSGEPQPLLGNPGAPSSDFTAGTNDISKDAKFTLGAYLSVKTSKNEYPVAFPVAGAASPSQKSRGENASLLDPSSNGQQAFAADSKSIQTLKSAGLGVKVASELVGQNRLMTFFDQNQIDAVLSKNSSDASKTGNDLLRGIPNDTTNPVGKQKPASVKSDNLLLGYIHQQLKDGNMFSPDPAENQPFTSNPDGKTEEDITRGLFSIQRKLGHFDVNGERVQVSDMSAMAMSLLLRSVGNDSAAASILGNESLSDTSLSALSIVLRSAQFGATGQGIEAFRLSNLRNISASQNAKKAEKATGQDDFIIKSESNKNIITKGTLPNNAGLPNLQSSPSNAGSYSQLNTFLEPFAVGTRFSSTGMFTMATSAALVMIGVGLAIDAIAGIAKSDSKPNRDIKTPALLAMGRHKPESSVAGTFSKLLQITRTDYDFSNCVGTGIALLYGLSNNSAISAAALSSPSSTLVIAQNLILAGGFYANFTRRMISSATDVANVFAKVSFGNVTQGIEGVLRGIENLLDSVIYKFIMVAAGVGDAALKSQLGMTDVTSDSRLLNYDLAASLDYKKFGEGLELASKQNIAGQLGIYRNQIHRWGKAGINALSLQTFYASQKDVPFYTTADMHNRGLAPSREVVQLIEDAIESEYMPFYIHDLRTHEVMSMPAFITEFGETFSPNYNSVEGIGRQDPVRLYQKTERAVTFGFMLVAYNEDDHDQLWWTVNKLIAMCYPQYSEGRERITSDGIKFTQPFSQVQAASPMVRLRLGDVFKSNYSKFGLTRLFNVKSDDLQVAADLQKAKDKLAAAQKGASKRINEIVRRAKDPKSATDVLPIGYRVNIKEAVKPKNAEGNALAVSQEGDIIELSKGEEVTIKSVIPNITKKYGKSVFDFDYLVERTATSGVPLFFGSLRISYSSIEGMSDENKEIFVSADPNVISANAEIARLQQNPSNSAFFESSKNAIVRSFETTRGRGVAGFITSLGLDYGMNSTPWVTTPGRKAPMFVKISLGFAPITDLPLGLGYNGNIRNPSHPVGKLAGGFGDVYQAEFDKPQPFDEKRFEGATGVADAKSEIQKSFNQGSLNRPSILP